MAHSTFYMNSATRDCIKVINQEFLTSVVSGSSGGQKQNPAPAILADTASIARAQEPEANGNDEMETFQGKQKEILQMQNFLIALAGLAVSELPTMTTHEVQVMMLVEFWTQVQNLLDASEAYRGHLLHSQNHIGMELTGEMLWSRFSNMRCFFGSVMFPAYVIHSGETHEGKTIFIFAYIFLTKA
jgi:hypothetical protein